MIRRCLAVALITTLPGMALAREIPAPGQRDARMRTVVYDPGQVVRLSTVTGTALVVTFATNEKISAVAVTDSKDLTAMPRDNFLFLKSRDILPSQPVVVLTKGPRGVRRYVFEIEAISPTRQAAEQRDIFYSVEFRYPADRAAEALAAQRQRERIHRGAMAQATLTRARETLDQASRSPSQPASIAAVNWRYVAQGSRLLTPDTVYDNGNSTFFHFRGNTRMPALFRINPDGKEATVSPSVKGDWMVAGVVAAGWRLRDGTINLTIWNRAYDPAGRPPGTGTISSAVRRVMKDNKR